jgi:hypothetical protein
MYLLIVAVLGVFAPVLVPFWLIRRMDRAREQRDEREREAIFASMRTTDQPQTTR